MFTISFLFCMQLYGRYPEDNDRADMIDSRLGSKFVFEVTFVAAANVHYITVRSYTCMCMQLQPHQIL
jgi:hypothetical protein